MAKVSVNSLLEAGVHFGHQTKRWNPKMDEYIYQKRDDIHIIDLQKTAKLIENAYDVVKDISANGGKVLFVGTRKQAEEAIKEEAVRSESYYVNKRWLGGTLTNFATIRSRVRRIDEIEKMEKDGLMEVLPKKEVASLNREYEKLTSLLSGIRDMNKLPAALFIVDPEKEDNAIREARRLKIPVIGIVDTNNNPDMVDYIIPANDDAIRAVRLITSIIADAVIEGNSGVAGETGTSVKEEQAVKEEVKKTEPVKEVNKVEEEPIKEEKVVSEVEDFSALTVAKLREIAKEKDVKGYSTMKKAELVEALN